MSFKEKRFLGVISMVLVSSLLIFAMILCDSVNMICASAAPGNNITTLTNEKKEKEDQLNEAKARAAELEEQKKENAAKQLTYQEEIAQIDEEIALLTEQLYLLEELETSWLNDKAEAEATIAALEDTKENEIRAFESMLRMSYQYGDDTYFNLLFGSEDIGDFLSRLDMIDYHLKASENIVSSLSATIVEEQNAKAVLEESISKIDIFGAEKDEIMVQLEQRSAEAEAKKKALQEEEEILLAEISAKDAEMAEMEAELKRISDELEAERREQEKNNQSPSTSPKQYDGGTFYVPTERYVITSEFMNRISPITGKPESHNGIDFAAPGGTNIYAAEDGQVIRANYSSSWGNVIQIDHGGGLVTLYAHCSWLGVTKGQTVTKGQIIAKVGTTGWSTGNHLHFTVYEKGVAVNPRKYLPKNI